MIGAGPGSARRDPDLGPLQISAGGPLAIGEGEEVIRLRELARPTSPSTSAGWGPGAGTSTTTWPAATATRRKPPRSRTSTLAGKKDEAAALVPDEFLELTSLVGPRSWVAERIAAMRRGGRDPFAGHADPDR